MPTQTTPTTEPREQLGSFPCPPPAPPLPSTRAQLPLSASSPSLSSPSTDVKPSLPSKVPSTDVPNPHDFLIYFDPRSERAGSLCGELFNRTQHTTTFVTTTLSKATHVVVEPPSTLADGLVRARAQSSSPSLPQYILSLPWIEDSIHSKTWQPEERYLCNASVEVKEELQQPRIKREAESMDVDDNKPQVKREEKRDIKIESAIEPDASFSIVEDLLMEDETEEREEEGRDGKGKEREVLAADDVEQAGEGNSGPGEPLDDGLGHLEPMVRSGSVAWNSQEISDLALCLREGCSIRAAAERFNKMHPRRTVRAAERYYGCNRLKFVDDFSKGAAAGLSACSSSWTKIEEKLLIGLLASDPPRTKRASFRLFVEQQPTYTVHGLERWYSKHRKRVDKAVQKLKVAQSSSDPTFLSPPSGASTRKPERRVAFLLSYSFLDGDLSADFSFLAGLHRPCIPYSSQESHDLRRFLSDSQSTKEAAEKMSKEHTRRSWKSVKSYLWHHQSEFENELAAIIPVRQEWSCKEEEDLVRLLADAIGTFGGVYEAFHLEHPTRTVPSVRQHHLKYRTRIDKAVKVSRMESSSSSSSVPNADGSSSSSSPPRSNTDASSSSSSKRPSDDQPKSLVLKFKRPRLSSSSEESNPSASAVVASASGGSSNWFPSPSPPLPPSSSSSRSPEVHLHRAPPPRSFDLSPSFGLVRLPPSAAGSTGRTEPLVRKDAGGENREEARVEEDGLEGEGLEEMRE
ncbi:hypothetical protein BDY24DRAFT_397158 [Mrakia frigida]|uniref:uncharacterized protein n=1 Tax=Mrakia frigida TaxID=29902 RepID=UPI003FCC19FE